MRKSHRDFGRVKPAHARCICRCMRKAHMRKAYQPSIARTYARRGACAMHAATVGPTSVARGVSSSPASALWCVRRHVTSCAPRAVKTAASPRRSPAAIAFGRYRTASARVVARRVAYWSVVPYLYILYYTFNALFFAAGDSNSPAPMTARALGRPLR